LIFEYQNVHSNIEPDSQKEKNRSSKFVTSPSLTICMHCNLVKCSYESKKYEQKSWGKDEDFKCGYFENWKRQVLTKRLGKVTLEIWNPRFRTTKYSHLKLSTPFKLCLLITHPSSWTLIADDVMFAEVARNLIQQSWTSIKKKRSIH